MRCSVLLLPWVFLVSQYIQALDDALWTLTKLAEHDTYECRWRCMQAKVWVHSAQGRMDELLSRRMSPVNRIHACTCIMIMIHYRMQLEYCRKHFYCHLSLSKNLGGCIQKLWCNQEKWCMQMYPSSHGSTNFPKLLFWLDDACGNNIRYVLTTAWLLAYFLLCCILCVHVIPS